MFILKRKQGKSNEMVQVVAKCRPITQTEISQGHVNVVRVLPLENAVEIYDPKNKKMDHCKVFTFDAVYDWNNSLQEMYVKMIHPLVDAVLTGFNSTIFAYGQSGTGKTYTMEGKVDEDGVDSKGVILLSFEHIFDHISKSENLQYLVRMSYLEIYQDNIRDLLDKNQSGKYELRESTDSGVYVKNIRSFVCKNVKQMKSLWAAGRQTRSVGSTDVNERSSRSHAVLTIVIENSDMEGPLKNQVRVGKLNLVDLAGSERQSKTNASDHRLKEASKINLSLTALGNVISALSENNGSHIPYRDSKLTRLLQDSLGGNAKTLMIANIGPASYNYDESVNTLRYATRARNIKNEPRVNEDPVDALLREYLSEIQRLKSQLAEKTKTQREQKSKNRKGIKPIITENDFLSLDDDSKNSLKSNDLILTAGLDLRNEVGNQQNKDIYLESEEYVNDLSKRIESMENKLLTGSSSILEHTSEQQKILQAQNNQIIQSKEREKDITKYLKEQDEAAGGIREEYSNLQQEVDMKFIKLNNIFLKLQSVRQEIQDVHEEFNTDRRELEIITHELIKGLKLRVMVMENFIPKEDRRRILSRVFFDDESDSWKVNESVDVIPRLKCVDCMRGPVTLYSMFTHKKADHLFLCDPTKENRDRMLRFKGENVLDHDLLYAKRTTKDYEHTDIPPFLNSIFQTALQEEKDLDIDAANPIFRNYPSFKRSREFSQKRPSIINNTAKILQSMSSRKVPVYPKPRGLVPK